MAAFSWRAERFRMGGWMGFALLVVSAIAGLAAVVSYAGGRPLRTVAPSYAPPYGSAGRVVDAE